MKLIIFLVLVLTLAVSASAVTDSVLLLDSDGNLITTAPNAWDNITIRVTNSAASSYTVNVTSTADSTGITVTLASVGSNTYEGWFRPAEVTSSSSSHIIYVADGSTITVSADLDADGNIGTNTVTYDNDPDEIQTYSSLPSAPNTGTETTSFVIGDTVYIVITTAKNSGGTITAASSIDSLSVSLSESATYDGWYTGSFQTQPSTGSSSTKLKVAQGDTITLTSDLEGDDSTDATKTLTIADNVEILATPDKSSVSTVNAWDDLTVRVTNIAANTNSGTIQTGSVTINSTTDGTGITVTVTETAVDSGIFEGTFKPSETASSDANDYIQAADEDTIYVYSDLDRDGTYTTDSVEYDVNPDEIITRKTASGSASTYFKSTDTVYVDVYAKAGASSPEPLTVTSSSDSNGTTMAVTESGTYVGKYSTSFSISTSTAQDTSIKASDGDSIIIKADVDAGETGGGDSPDTTKTIYVDDTAPSSATPSPSDNSYLKSSQKRNITVTITDNMYTASSITLHYRLGAAGSWSSATMSLCTAEICGSASSQGTSTTYYAQIDDTAVSDGDTVSFYVTGTDEAGNSITTSVGGSTSSPLSTYTIDDVAPTISSFQINGATSDIDVYNKMNFTINWNATYSPDITEAYYTVSYTNGTLLTGWNKTIATSASSCTASTCPQTNIDAMDMPTGTLNLTLFCKDTAGNWANTSLTFTSKAYVTIVSTSSSPSSGEVSNDGSGKYTIKFVLDLKGSYVKFKIGTFTNSANSNYTFNGAGRTTMYYTNAAGTSKSLSVGSTYGSTNPDAFKDLTTSTPYLVDTEVNLTIKIPRALYPGTYTGSYFIWAYD